MNLANRIYADYLAPARFDEYERLIERALDEGFKHHTIYELYSQLPTYLQSSDKHFVHRHDIDTDKMAAKLFFEKEKQFGIKASYYFRLSTIDIDLMREIHEYGSEVGYHFEEIATIAKRSRLRTKQDVLDNISRIEDEFIKNFINLKERLGFRIRTTALHGDFANRRLNIGNKIITNNQALRRQLGIECDAYDDRLMSYFDAYLSDAPPKQYYSRGSPFETLKSKKRICLLTHPRHWRTNFIVNTKDNIMRVLEELRWQV